MVKSSRREFLSAEVCLAMTLKYLAHGGSFVNLCFEFRVGHSTASQTIRSTCNVLWDVLQCDYLKSPSNEEGKQISKLFWKKWNLPNTLGAIDGKHVTVQCPKNSGSLYINYKKYFSVVLLACCDAEYKFTWVDIGEYGSENDAGIFRRSKINNNRESINRDLPKENLPGSEIEFPYVFVGDEAFPLSQYLIRPYPGRGLNEKRKIFNYRLSRARRTIENCFGILASRWRVYMQPLLCSVETTENIIKATVCLHNFLRTEICDEYAPSTLTNTVLENGDVIEGNWRHITQNDGNLTPVGRVGTNTSSQNVYNQRDVLSDNTVSTIGSIPWQLHYVTRGK